MIESDSSLLLRTALANPVDDSARDNPFGPLTPINENIMYNPARDTSSNTESLVEIEDSDNNLRL
jgi:hypothetical protein